VHRQRSAVHPNWGFNEINPLSFPENSTGAFSNPEPSPQNENDLAQVDQVAQRKLVRLVGRAFGYFAASKLYRWLGMRLLSRALAISVFYVGAGSQSARQSIS
jgi:hypothetical protein